MDLRYPQVLDFPVHEDLRGGHHKFFGSKPESLAVPSYSIAEVFMTLSHFNVLRGIHFQRPAQPKIIQVLTGTVLGNIVCCNPDLPEFGSSMQFTLNETSPERLYIPGDWAQGYRVMEDHTRVLYLAGADFDPDGDVGIDPFDPALGLHWGQDFTREDAVMAPRDRELPPFENFVKSLDQAREGM